MKNISLEVVVFGVLGIFGVLFCAFFLPPSCGGGAEIAPEVIGFELVSKQDNVMEETFFRLYRGSGGCVLYMGRASSGGPLTWPCPEESSAPTKGAN